MIYQTNRPGPPLDELVDYFWFFESSHTAHHSERVLPDGTFEWVIDLKDTPRKLFRQDSPGEYREFRGSWISGTRADYITIDVLDDASMIGVHFKPGGAAAFLSRPADELAARVEETTALFGGAANDLREALLEERSTVKRFALLEHFLLRRLTLPARRISHAVRRLTNSPQTARISVVADELGISQKHFIALFRAQVGLTPKTFCRVRRFHNALNEIGTKRKLEWAEIAAGGGYYDQSHFIHDFHAFSGFNPSAYLTHRGEYLGFVPVKE